MNNPLTQESPPFVLPHATQGINLNTFGLLAIKGQDAPSFLQGQLTLNLDNVTEEDWKLGAYCTRQGKVVSVFWLTKRAPSTAENGTPHFLLAMPKAILQNTLDVLMRYGRFSKVTLTIEDHNHLVGFFGKPPLQLKASATHMAPLFSDPFERQMGLVPTIPPESITNASSNPWLGADILQGIPHLSLETLGFFTPHVLDLPRLGAISFDKGCYIGQEIVARTQYRGTVKKKLQTQRVDDLPSPEKTIFQTYFDGEKTHTLAILPC